MHNPSGHRRDELAASINVTPMVDVMLVLLILFMVLTATQPYTARLPHASAALPAAEDRVTLGIDREGAYWLGRARVPAPELAGRLEAAYAARDAGVRRLAMITEQPRRD
jgi:biopolymer transport protein ExbD